MVIVHVSKRVIATASGTVMKAVTCEKCATEFYYQMTRVGEGVANAPLLLSDKSARSEAQESARRLLIRRLEEDHELVPCPKCQWVNEAAIQAYRKMRYVGLDLFVFLFFAGTVLMLIALVIGIAKHRPLEPDILAITLAFPLGGFGVLAVRAALRSRIDPNRYAVMGVPRLPPGTPPALIRNAADEFVVAPSDHTKLPETAEWATYHGLNPELEPVCCQCLGTPTETFRLPFTLGTPSPVPLCRSCLGRLRRRFWLWLLAVLLPVAAAPYPLARMLTRDTLLQGVLITGTIVGGGAIGLCVAAALATPYRVGSVDESRALRKIKFRNPAYTALLVRKYAKQDGIA